MIDKPPLFHTATRDSDRSNANTAFRLRSFQFKFFCSHRLSFSFVLLVGFLSAISLPDFVIARFTPPPRPASHPPLPPRRPEGGWFPLRIERIERSQRGSTRRSRTPSALLRETTWPSEARYHVRGRLGGCTREFCKPSVGTYTVAQLVYRLYSVPSTLYRSVRSTSIEMKFMLQY